MADDASLSLELEQSEIALLLAAVWQAMKEAEVRGNDELVQRLSPIRDRILFLMPLNDME